MLRPSALAAAFAVLLAGCATTSDPALADLPTGDGIYAAIHRACGLQHAPTGDLFVTYGAGTLYHLRVQSDTGRGDESLAIPRAEAERVLQDAARVGVVNLTSYDDWNGGTGHVFLHAEARDLSAGERARLRSLVEAADFPSLASSYAADEVIADGCSFAFAAPADGGYKVVETIDDGGPARLDAYRDGYLGLHPS